MIMNAREMIGPYRLEKQIGYGSMSDVYIATDTRNITTVAIKVIYPHLLDHSGMLERFTREAEALKALRHSNIMQIYEYVNKPDMAYLVMEAVGGGTLEERMDEARRNGRFIPPEIMLRWMVDICQAVDFAHSQGMIHRDLKPSNILFRSNDQPVLSDFGLAFLMHHPRISSSNSIIGTPAYMSPEQVNGETGDTQSDIYSLGVILYEILTGETPFSGTSINVLIKHVSEDPPSPREIRPEIPQPVADVVLRALAKDPAQRYQKAQTLIEALFIAYKRAEARKKSPVSRLHIGSRPVTPPQPQPQPSVATTERSMASPVIPKNPVVGIQSQKHALSGRGAVMTGIVMLLLFIGITAWGLVTGHDEEDLPTGAPRISVGTYVQVVVPNNESTSFYKDCPSNYWEGVLGVVTAGEKGKVVDRMGCNGEWWYRVSLDDKDDLDWSGTGWIAEDKLSP